MNILQQYCKIYEEDGKRYIRFHKDPFHLKIISFEKHPVWEIIKESIINNTYFLEREVVNECGGCMCGIDYYSIKLTISDQTLSVDDFKSWTEE